MLYKTSCSLITPMSPYKTCSPFSGACGSAETIVFFAGNKPIHTKSNMAVQALVTDMELEAGFTSDPKQMPTGTGVNSYQIRPVTSRVPSPGSTFCFDVSIAGPKIYSDAAWKKRNQSPNHLAGIGIYIHWQVDGTDYDLFVQAKNPRWSRQFKQKPRLFSLQVPLRQASN